MKPLAISPAEQGMALVISLLFLLVVTVISVVAARNSTLSTRMSSNMQDAYSSFQSAEAGVIATMLLRDTPEDPFMGTDVDDPFANFSPDSHPLRDLNGGPQNMTVNVHFNDDLTAECPRRTPDKVNSIGAGFECEYYRIDSENDAPQRARTRVGMGVVKTLLKSGQL